MKRSLRVTVFGLLAASVFFFAFENRLLAAQTDSPGTSYELLVDFQIDDIDVSPDGKFAIAWGVSEPQATASVLTAIDIENRNVLSSKTFEHGIVSAAIGAKPINYDVFVVPKKEAKSDTGSVFQLQHNDLEEIASSEINGLGKWHHHVGIIGKHYLVVGSEMFQLPDFTKVDLSPLGVQTDFERYSEVSRMETELTYFAGALWDHDLTKPQLLVDRGFFYSFGNMSPEVFPGKWGIARERSQMIRPSYKKRSIQRAWIKPPSSNGYKWRTVLLDEFPVVCKIYNEPRSRNGLGPKVDVQNFGDLRPQVFQKIPIAGIKSLNERKSWIKQAGSTMFVVNEDRVFIIPNDQIDNSKVEAPMFIQRTQPMLSIKPPRRRGKDQVELKYEISGGKAPFQATLNTWMGGEAQCEGRKISFDVDLASRRKLTIDDFKHRYRTPERVENYMKACTPYFKQIVGRKPAGVPVFSTADVRVKDADGKVAQMSHGYLVELPFDAIMPKGKKKKRRGRSKK